MPNQEMAEIAGCAAHRRVLFRRCGVRRGERLDFHEALSPGRHDKMNPCPTDGKFTGSIPQLYEQYLVPLIFESYAADLASRVAQRNPTRVLELAAGTGAVTRHLARTLAATTRIVATDLNEPMLKQAASTGTAREIEWRQADAMQLPFAEGIFDVVVCQFAVMFFPDKRKAFAEARRVLRRGGCFLFNVWDCLEANEFADTVTRALEAAWPENPPRFLARVPHGYYNRSVITDDLAGGGFEGLPEYSLVSGRSRAESPLIPAVAYCQGTPLRGEIEARNSLSLGQATELATAALGNRFGAGAVDGKIQAYVVSINR